MIAFLWRKNEGRCIRSFLTAFGFKEVYVSCVPTNIASRKTILANGGEYIETKYLECDNVNLERYRICI